MAQYIDAAYLEAKLGTALFADIQADNAGVDFDVICREATATVMTRLRGAGYTPPELLTGGDIAEDTADFLRLATYALVREELESVPDVSLPLPEGWERSQAKKAITDIESGEADLNLPVNTDNAVGGVLFTETDPSLDDGQPQFTSRDNLGGF